LKYAILQKKKYLNSLNRLNCLFIYKINNNWKNLIKQIDVPSGVLNIIYYYMRYLLMIFYISNSEGEINLFIHIFEHDTN
jgi:hypothetical protein